MFLHILPIIRGLCNPLFCGHTESSLTISLPQRSFQNNMFNFITAVCVLHSVSLPVGGAGEQE